MLETRKSEPLAHDKQGRVWPLMVGALLLANFVGVAVLVWLAASDRSFFVEPDYHRRALHWNDRMAQQRENERLGWRLDVALHRVAVDRAVVEARISGRDGSPIEGASVHVETFHKARAARVLEADLDAREPGAYAAELKMWRRGRWEVRVAVQRGHQRYERRVDREL